MSFDSISGLGISESDEQASTPGVTLGSYRGRRRWLWWLTDDGVEIPYVPRARPCQGGHYAILGPSVTTRTLGASRTTSVLPMPALSALTPSATSTKLGPSQDSEG